MPEESDGIIDDLLSNAPGAEIILLMKYNPEADYTSVSMRSTTNQADVGKIAASMGGGGHVRAAGFKVRDGRSFDEVVSEALKKVRDYQKERLNIHLDNEKKTDQPKAQSSEMSKSAEGRRKEDRSEPPKDKKSG